MFRPTVLAWWIWAAAVALFVLCGLLFGCASAPVQECPAFRLSVAEDQNGETVFVLDAENLGKLIETLRGLSRGTCKPAPNGVPA